MSLKLSTIEAIEKIYLLDYGNKNTLIGKSELEILSKKISFFRGKLEFIVGGNGLMTQHDKIWRLSLNVIDNIANKIFDECELAHQILIMGNGKISFCGERASSILTYGQAVKYNLFIHSCSLLEAEELIKECRRISSDTMMYDKDKDNYQIMSRRIRIKISCTIFKDKEEALSSNNANISKYGWDPINGFFCTLAAGIIFLLGGFPLDRRLTDKEVFKYGLSRPAIFSSCDTSAFLEHLGEREVANIIRDINGVPLYDEMTGISAKPSRVSIYANVPLTFYQQKLVAPYPTIAEYFGKHYIPTIVGINNNRYVAFANVKRPFNVNHDIFRIICSYWLKMEIDDTYTNLLLPI